MPAPPWYSTAGWPQHPGSYFGPGCRGGSSPRQHLQRHRLCSPSTDARLAFLVRVRLSCHTRGYALARPSRRTASAASSRSSPMRSAHAWCSGFMSTERRQVTCPRSRSIPAARGRRSARQVGEREVQVAPRGLLEDPAREAERSLASGARTGPHHDVQLGREGGRKRASAPEPRVEVERRRRGSRRACARIRRRASSGSRRCVAQSATAAAPGREHSRLISPRCSSLELK